MSVSPSRILAWFLQFTYDSFVIMNLFGRKWKFVGKNGKWKFVAKRVRHRSMMHV